MNLKIFSLRKNRKAMALPLTLIFLLVGAVLVGTALYVVENMHSTSRHVVTETQLYNAAQSGVEQGRIILWDKRADLDLDDREYVDDLDDIRVRRKNTAEPLDKEEGLQDLPINGLPGVKLVVDLLDCNYSVNETTYNNMDPDKIAALPPRWPGGEGGEGTGESEGPSEGTSVIIDPSRFFNIGGGGGGERRFVIRSSAFETREGGQEVKIEVMVVLLQ